MIRTIGELRRPLPSSLPWINPRAAQRRLVAGAGRPLPRSPAGLPSRFSASSRRAAGQEPPAEFRAPPTVPLLSSARHVEANPVDFSISGPINAIAAKRLSLNLMRTGPVVIEVNSEGGLFRCAELMVESLSFYSAKVGHVTLRLSGQCSSAAIGLLAAADWVEAFSDVRFLLHVPASIVSDGARWTAAQHRRQAKYLEGTEQIFFDWMVQTSIGAYRRRGVPADEVTIRGRFEAAARTETWLTAVEAYSLGLIDEVI